MDKAVEHLVSSTLGKSLTCSNPKVGQLLGDKARKLNEMWTKIVQMAQEYKKKLGSASAKARKKAIHQVNISNLSHTSNSS